MAKIECSLIDKNTIKLESDAKKGDIIDLQSLKVINTSLIEEKINNAKDEVYNKLLEQKISELSSKYELSLANEISRQKDQLNEISKKQEDSLRQQIDLLNVKINDLNSSNLILQNEIKNINSNKDKFIETEVLNQKLELSSKFEEKHRKEIELLNTELTKKISEISSLKTQYEYEKSIELNNMKNSYNEITRNLELKNKELENDLNLTKLRQSTLSVKSLGENFENWCLNEYQKYSFVGFKNCTFEKITISKGNEDSSKKEKADFLFSIFADETKKNLLTSVCLEMKTENELSKNKKHNKDHFEKLDKDRKNEKAEYALLVTELENTENSPLISKVDNFENMYWVRPQYMITFLALLNSITTKFASDISKMKEKDIQFKSKTDLLNEFNNLKTELLNISIVKVQSQCNEILTNVNRASKSLKNIEECANKIISSSVEKVQNYINNLKLEKFLKKID